MVVIDRILQDRQQRQRRCTRCLWRSQRLP